jgi:hypothetical protein
VSTLALASLPPALTSVATRPLFALRLAVDPPTLIGTGPAGDRRVATITGGSFEGERLRGKVLAGGTDWSSLRTDGSLVLDARVVLETDDGAILGVRYVGVRRGPPEVMARLAKGEEVNPADYYFRMTPSFETSAPAYAWLNGIVAVGTGHRYVEGPLYSLFEVL